MPALCPDPAFTALYRHYHGLIRTHLAHLLGAADPALLDDLAQDTFVRLWQAMQVRGLRFEAEPKACAYLVQIATNLVRDHWRRTRCVPMERLAQLAPTSDEESVPEPGVAVYADAREALLDVRQALSTLPPSYRATLLLAAAGYRPVEQAALLDLSVPAAKMLLMRARRALRRACREEQGAGMADRTGERDHDPLARLVARFRAILRKGAQIIEPSLRSDGHLEATIRLEDGRAGRFIVVFLDEDGEEGGDEHVLVVERATDRASDYQPFN